jgi:hypothetical protein
MPIPELLQILSIGCPRRQAMRSQTADVCGIHCPGLASLR